MRMRCPGFELLLGLSLHHLPRGLRVWVMSCLNQGVLGRARLQLSGARPDPLPVQQGQSLLLASHVGSKLCLYHSPT